MAGKFCRCPGFLIHTQGKRCRGEFFPFRLQGCISPKFGVRWAFHTDTKCRVLCGISRIFWSVWIGYHWVVQWVTDDHDTESIWVFLDHLSPFESIWVFESSVSILVFWVHLSLLSPLCLISLLSLLSPSDAFESSWVFWVFWVLWVNLTFLNATESIWVFWVHLNLLSRSQHLNIWQLSTIWLNSGKTDQSDNIWRSTRWP